MFNAVVIAVLLMIVLCLCRLNVVISLFISALVGGLISGMSVGKGNQCIWKKYCRRFRGSAKLCIIGWICSIDFI